MRKRLESEMAKHESTNPDIIAAKQENPNADTTALEREIDNLVYALYGLTPEEVAIIESGSKSS
jgi:hypothetical protein